MSTGPDQRPIPPETDHKPPLFHLVRYRPGDDVMTRACDGKEVPFQWPEGIPLDYGLCVVCVDLAELKGVAIPC